MSLVLLKNEVCPHAETCPHNISRSCWGANPNRDNKFICSFVKDNCKVEGEGFRSEHDQTGKMQILLEDSKNG